MCVCVCVRVFTCSIIVFLYMERREGWYIEIILFYKKLGERKGKRREILYKIVCIYSEDVGVVVRGRAHERW